MVETRDSRARRLPWWLKASLGVAAIGAIVLVALGLFATWKRKQSADIHVTNDLELPVRVSIGKTLVSVCPRCEVSVRAIPKGAQHVVVTRDDGRVIEEEDVSIRGGVDATVVNVLGASPIFEEKVFYAKNGKAPGSEPRLFVGNPFVIRDPVDYVFVEPPQNLSLDSSTDSMSKTYVGRANEGVEVSIGYLLQNDPSHLPEFLRALALAEPESEEMTGRAIDSFETPVDQIAFIDRLLTLRPEDVDLHRRRQNLFVLLGKGGDVIADYKARYATNPSSVNAAYLYAAVLPRSEARLLLEKVVVAHPDDPYVVRLLGAIAYQERRFGEAAALLTKLERDAHHHKVVLGEHAAALLASEGPSAALAMLSRLSDEERAEPIYWVVYGQVVARARARGAAGANELDPTAAVPKVTTPDDWALLYMQWGIDPPPALKLEIATAAASDIGLAVRRDPTKAIELFEKAAPQAKTRLLAVPALAIATEAGRLGKRSVAKAAYAVVEATLGKDPPLEAFVVDGREDEALDGEPISVRAVVELARSRRQSDPKKRAALESQANGDDPLIGVVSDALRAWPAP